MNYYKSNKSFLLLFLLLLFCFANRLYILLFRISEFAFCYITNQLI
jgi:hypothetical protein